MKRLTLILALMLGVALGAFAQTSNISETYTPGDTITVTATNLLLMDETNSRLFAFKAYDSKYQVSVMVMSNHVTGSFTEDDFILPLCGVYIIENNSTTDLSITKASIQVRLAKDGEHYVVTGYVVTEDGSTFIIDFSFCVPEKSRSLDLVFHGGSVNFSKNINEFSAGGYSTDISYYLFFAYYGEIDAPTRIYEAGVILTETTETGIINYYYRDGNIAVTYENGNVVYTGTFIMQSEYDPADVIELTFSMNNKFKTDDPYKYDEKKEDFEHVFSQDEVKVSLFPEYDQILVSAQSADNYGFKLLFIFAPVEDPIPAFEYHMDKDTENGCVVRSSGYTDNYMNASYACTLDGQYIDKCWFLINGNVSVKVVDGHNEIYVDAVNTNGCHVRVTLSTPTVILPAMEDAPMTMPMYDLSGRPVTDSSHGIVIRNGKKYLR